jgi:eukaryotic-like serine/threonine-protein kinase
MSAHCSDRLPTLTLPARARHGADPVSGAGDEARFGRYEVRAPIGEGGMGAVYEAFDPVLERAVAIKVLRRDCVRRDEHAARLLREAVAMARLCHPNVVRVYDAGVDRGQSFVVMELVHGDTLATWTDAAPRTIRELLAMYVQAGRGLAAAHDAGLVHRDFKPENVLVARDGRVLVTDFGLARSADDTRSDVLAQWPTPVAPFVTAPGVVVGTPEFMAPEQRRGGAVDARADQYSFCLALWHALPGSARLPGRVRAALLRGLATNPDERFASMHDLLAVLAPCVIEASHVRAPRAPRRRPATSPGSVATRPGRVRRPS